MDVDDGDVGRVPAEPVATVAAPMEWARNLVAGRFEVVGEGQCDESFILDKQHARASHLILRNLRSLVFVSARKDRFCRRLDDSKR
jgi:hypothetical protein